MVISPGKVGELLKSYLLKQEADIPIARTLPVVFMERLFDLIGLLILAAWGFYLFTNSGEIVLPNSVEIIFITIAGIISFIIIVLLIPPAARIFLSLFEKIPLIGKMASPLEQVYNSANELMLARSSAISLLLSVFAWLAECTGLYLIIKLGFNNLEFTINKAAYIYSVSTLAGVVSPGGLGITDASLVGLLGIYISNSDALIAAFIIRLATLWFAVLLGGMFIMFFYKKIPNLSEAKTKKK